MIQYADDRPMIQHADDRPIIQHADDRPACRESSLHYSSRSQYLSAIVNNRQYVSYSFSLEFYYNFKYILFRSVIFNSYSFMLMNKLFNHLLF